MGKINYINGTILIRTRDFKYHVEDGCLFHIPEGANVLEPNEIVEGTACFVIDDKSSISIFDTFRASGGYSSLCSGSYYFNSSYQEVYENYLLQRGELVNFMNSINDDCHLKKTYAYKMIFMNIMTLLDAFMCELYISKLTSDESLFYKQLNKTKKKGNIFKVYIENYGPNEERSFIYYIRNQSYINDSKINEIAKMAWHCTDDVISEKSPIRSWIKLRHDVAHNNAREINGNFHCFTKEEVLDALNDVDSLIKNIMDICYE